MELSRGDTESGERAAWLAEVAMVIGGDGDRDTGERGQWSGTASSGAQRVRKWGFFFFNYLLNKEITLLGLSLVFQRCTRNDV